MTQHENVRYLLVFTLGISFFGLSISLVFASYPPSIQEGFLWRKPLVGIIFGLLCVFGMFAAVFPKRCSRVHRFGRREENHASRIDATRLAGHHPDCAGFSSHVIQIRNRTLCAACTGLFIGASIDLIGITVHFFSKWNIGISSLAAVFIGTVGVTLGFLQLIFNGFCRLTFNIVFVVGAFLILAGIDEITQSLLIDLFLLSLVVFWIWTRIILSRWDHWRICTNCQSRCMRVSDGEGSGLIRTMLCTRNARKPHILNR